MKEGHGLRDHGPDPLGVLLVARHLGGHVDLVLEFGVARHVAVGQDAESEMSMKSNCRALFATLSVRDALSLELLEVADEVGDAEPVPVGLGGVGRPDPLLRRAQLLQESELKLKGREGSACVNVA